MQRVIQDMVKGPFKNEQDFKKAVIKRWEQVNKTAYHLCIESPETEAGMPDVISVSANGPAVLTEFR